VSTERSDDVSDLIAALRLEPHPEGGWYRRTWTAAPDRGDDSSGPRAAGSSIIYLLDAEVSRWHRIDATELWHHTGGDPVQLSRWADDGTPIRVDVLGGDPVQGQVQVTVEPGTWQSATSLGAWSLVVCVVIPEFRFEGFELAEEGWEPPQQ